MDAHIDPSSPGKVLFEFQAIANAACRGIVDPGRPGRAEETADLPVMESLTLREETAKNHSSEILSKLHASAQAGVAGAGVGAVSVRRLSPRR
jgi:hypothetical protein